MSDEKKITLAECRPEVQRFALLMEQKLRENDHKGGWQRDRWRDLSRRLDEEHGELRAVAAGCSADASAERRGEVAREAADVANFAMMIADVLGGLDDAGGSDDPR